MPGFVLAASTYTPPVVVPSQSDIWPGISAMTWTGWDGSVWDLISPGDGVKLQRGARGLFMDDPDRFSSVSPALAGSRDRGYRGSDRDVFWPALTTTSQGGSAWLALNRAFRRTLRPSQTGVWAVTDCDGNTRRLTLRYAGTSTPVMDLDPMRCGWKMDGLNLLARQPYWEGNPAKKVWLPADPKPFFGGVVGGKGPPFFLSSGSNIGTAVMSNPGDIDVYPIYTVTSTSISSVSVGYAGNVVQMGAIPSGQSRIIDTRPDRLTVVDQDGINKWSELGSTAQFDAPLPPGNPITMSLAMTGVGSITAEIIPLYEDAF